jgi:hypothetical protein
LASKKIQVRLYNRNGDTLTSILNGKMRNHYFKVNTKLSARGKPWLWGLVTNQNVIAKSKSGQLLVYHSHGGMVFFTVLPFFGTSIGVDKMELESIN